MNRAVLLLGVVLFVAVLVLAPVADASPGEKKKPKPKPKSPYRDPGNQTCSPCKTTPARRTIRTSGAVSRHRRVSA